MLVKKYCAFGCPVYTVYNIQSSCVEKKGVYMYIGHTAELLLQEDIKGRLLIHNISKNMTNYICVCMWVCVYDIKCNVRALRVSEPCLSSCNQSTVLLRFFFLLA